MSIHFDAEKIAVITEGTVIRPGPAGPMWTDTRSLPQGAWFVALRGDRFDAHNFLGTAADRGAAGFVVERQFAEKGSLPPQGGIVAVDDALAALQALGAASRKQFVGPVVGLTGSSGKTTTRALMSLAIGSLGPVHQTEGNLNNHIGVPLTLLARPDEAKAMVIEMGTSGPGEIGVLSRIATPDVRLVVNVGPAHLQELGGLDGVAHEKGALFVTAQPGNTVCVNLDDSRVASMPVPKGVRRLTWGERGDVALGETVVDARTLSTTATYRIAGVDHTVVIPAPGRHMAHNGAGAVCVALALGIDAAVAVAALAGYEAVGMRMRSEPLPNGGRALNDAYNANPASMEASLRLLASLPGRRAAVMGDMLELGSDEGAWHERVVALAGSLGLDHVVLVGPLMVAAAGALPSCEAHASPDAAVGPLLAWLASGTDQDVVLFKGSRGAQVERVLAGVRGESPVGGH